MLPFDQVEALPPAAAVRRKLDSFVIPWAWAVGVISYLDRTNLAFASVSLARDLGFDCKTYGIASGAFFVGYGIFQLPSVSMFHRLGIPWLVGTIVVWGLVALTFAAVRSRVGFITLRVFLGAVESGTYPTILAYLSRFYDANAVGTAYSMAASSTALASVLGSPVAASILLMDGVGGFRGWQWLFMVEGAVSVTFGAYAFAFMPREMGDVLRDAEVRSCGGGGVPASGKGLTTTGRRENAAAVMRDVLGSWRPHYLGCVFALVLLSMYGCVFFIPLLIHSFLAGSDTATSTTSTTPTRGTGAASCDGGEGAEGATNVAAVLLSAIPFGAAAIAMILIGKSSERMGERRLHGSVSVLFGAACMGGLALATALHAPAAVNILLLSLSAAGIWGVHAPLVSYPYAFLPKDQASVAFAVTNSWGALGGFLGPTILGVVAQSTGSYAISLAVLAAGAVVAAVMLYAFQPPPMMGGGSQGDAERLLA